MNKKMCMVTLILIMLVPFSAASIPGTEYNGSNFGFTEVTVTGPTQVIEKIPANYTIQIDKYAANGTTWYFKLNWDDGDETEWLGPYDPMTLVIEDFNHTWIIESTSFEYFLCLKLKTDTGYESNWSLIHRVIVYDEDDFHLTYPTVSGLYWIKSFLMQYISGTETACWKLADWSDKPFPYDTFMFIGKTTAYKFETPFLLMTHVQFNVSIYLDNKFYKTVAPFRPPFKPEILLFLFYFDGEGFHHIQFVPEDGVAFPVEFDFQLGLKGFKDNILPYLF